MPQPVSNLCDRLPTGVGGESTVVHNIAGGGPIGGNCILFRIKRLPELKKDIQSNSYRKTLRH